MDGTLFFNNLNTFWVIVFETDMQCNQVTVANRLAAGLLIRKGVRISEQRHP